MDLLKTVYDRVQQLAKKNRAGYGDESAFNDNIRSFERDFINWLVDQYKITNKVPALLQKLFKEEEIIIESGEIIYPEDMYRFLDLQRIDSSNIYPMDPIGAAEIATILQNSIRQPSETKRRYYFYEGTALKVFPSTMIGACKVLYVKIPTDTTIVFDFVSTPNGDEAVYNAGDSIQPEFPENALNYLIYGVARSYGIEINDPELVQYSLNPKTDATMKGLVV